MATGLNNLGLIYYDLGKYDTAEPLYRRSLAFRQKMLGPSHPDVANSLGNLGLLAFKQHNLAEAERNLTSAAKMYEATLGPAHPTTREEYSTLAEVCRRIGRKRDADEADKHAAPLAKQDAAHPK